MGEEEEQKEGGGGLSPYIKLFSFSHQNTI
jgi:hypothetical protein